MADYLQTASKSIEKQISKLQSDQAKALAIIEDQKQKVAALDKQIQGLRNTQKSLMPENGAMSFTEGMDVN